MGYPDGGFTGKGDGSLTDFAKEAKRRKAYMERCSINLCINAFKA